MPVVCGAEPSHEGCQCRFAEQAQQPQGPGEQGSAGAARLAAPDTADVKELCVDVQGLSAVRLLVVLRFFCCCGCLCCFWLGSPLSVVVFWLLPLGLLCVGWPLFLDARTGSCIILCVCPIASFVYVSGPGGGAGRGGRPNTASSRPNTAGSRPNSARGGRPNTAGGRPNVGASQ